MSILQVYTIPHSVLKTKTLEVKKITPEISALIANLVETMIYYPACVGIAAPQVGELFRIVVINAGLHKKKNVNHGLLILINPMITFFEGQITGREGCLSIPDFTANVTRYQRVVVEAVNENYEPVKIDASGFESIVLQHEIDHLNGLLFLDRVTSLKTDLFRRKR